MSSSGLVPIPSSKRVRNEYWVLNNTPLSVLMIPVPSRRFPFQTTEAVRFNLSVECITNLVRPTRKVTARAFSRPIPCTFQGDSQRAWKEPTPAT